MNWVDVLIGFLAFPIVALAVFMLINILARETPSEIRSTTDLQNHLREFLSSAKHDATLFLVWRPLNFEVRINKRVRKTEPDTLWLELRNSDANRSHYIAARDALEGSNLEFTESFTQVRRMPRRLRITWPDGRLFVVSAVAHAVTVIESTLPQASHLTCLASEHHPSLWRRRTKVAA